MHNSITAILLAASTSLGAASLAPAQTQSASRPQVKPYTMVQSVTSTQVFANGMTQTRTYENVNVRDAEQRTRNESEIAGTPAWIDVSDGRTSTVPAREKFKMISVYDPVTNNSYSWSTDPMGNHEVTVRQQESRRFRPSAPKPSAKPGDDVMKVERHTEQLGLRSFPGVVAEGQKIVRRYPAGFQGASQAYESTSETWIAQGFNVQVAATSDDPRSGKSVTTLVSFSEDPPDPSLFKPPAGYKIVEYKSQPSADKAATVP